MLGIQFHVDLQTMITLNFDKKLETLIKVLSSWKRRNLTPIGKITVIKTLLISIFNHLFITLPNPSKEFLKTINTLLFDFVWNGKSKVKNSILVKEYNQGGLNMTNIESFIASLKLTWIRRLCLMDGNWSLLAAIYIDKYKLLNCGKEYALNTANKITNMFWKDTLNAFVLLCSKQTVDSSNLYNYPLFYNEEILVNKKSIFNATCFEAGVFYVSDLMESRDKFMSHETFCSNFKIKINFLEFHGMVGAAKNFLKNNKIKDKNCLSNFNIRPIMPPLIDIILRNTTGAKPFYNLINSNDDFPISQTSWEKTFLQKFDAAEWQNIYNLPFILSKNSNLQWFQYRLNHRIIGTNDLLFKMNITTDDKCTF